MKHLYNVIHQANTLAANLGPDLNNIEEALVPQKLSTLAYIKTSIVSIQFILRDWNSTHDQLSTMAPIIIHASIVEGPPAQSLDSSPLFYIVTKFCPKFFLAFFRMKKSLRVGDMLEEPS